MQKKKKEKKTYTDLISSAELYSCMLLYNQYNYQVSFSLPSCKEKH